MFRKIPASIVFLSLFICCISVIHAERADNAKIIQLPDMEMQTLRVRSSLSSVDTCIVQHDGGLIYRIDGWVVGQELYKNYLDPSLTCENPYPFSVVEINMPLIFEDSTTITVSVDVEDVNLSDPNCPFPDTILGISYSYDLTVPGPGLYNIWIPFDVPVEVNGPFFAGFYIGAISNPLAAPALVTDSNAASICESYNMWDDSLGFIDLMNNSYFNFPGQIILYASGYTGGEPVEPEPAVSFITPAANSDLFGSAEIWVMEESGSSIIEYVSFSYSNGGTFEEISRDYDGYSPLRDESSAVGDGNGYSTMWDFSTLPEGEYTLRITAVDTMGRSASDEITVQLEPTPPVPEILSPENGSFFCDNVNILMSVRDENLLAISTFYKKSENSLLYGLSQVDGNSFSSYYSAPIAAACAIEYWADSKYNYLMQNGSQSLTIDELIETLAQLMNVTANGGAYDEQVYKAIETYLTDHGGVIKPKIDKTADYLSLRMELEYYSSPVIAALGGSEGRWVAIDGFSGPMVNDTGSLSIVNQLTGTVEVVDIRMTGGILEIQFNGSWQLVDMLISFRDFFGTIEQTSIGVDYNSLDGWSYLWQPTGLTDLSHYYIRAEGSDLTGKIGKSTILLQYDCSQSYIPGDINHDGLVNIQDLDYLISFYLNKGLVPVGGIQRADTNCDNHLNITDIIYLANYMFSNTAPPCN